MLGSEEKCKRKKVISVSYLSCFSFLFLWSSLNLTGKQLPEIPQWLELWQFNQLLCPCFSQDSLKHQLQAVTELIPFHFLCHNSISLWNERKGAWMRLWDVIKRKPVTRLSNISPTDWYQKVSAAGTNKNSLTIIQLKIVKTTWRMCHPLLHSQREKRLKEKLNELSLRLYVWITSDYLQPKKWNETWHWSNTPLCIPPGKSRLELDSKRANTVLKLDKHKPKRGIKLD